MLVVLQTKQINLANFVKKTLILILLTMFYNITKKIRKKDPKTNNIIDLFAKTKYFQRNAFIYLVNKKFKI